ncbi:hypothetical protein SCALM49S_02089 [Streptomyces californicus]
MRPAAISARRKLPIAAMRSATGSRASAHPGSMIRRVVLPRAALDRRQTTTPINCGPPGAGAGAAAPGSGPRPAPKALRQPSATARTHRTSGRCEASCRQLSPSSALAYNSPLRLPK